MSMTFPLQLQNVRGKFTWLSFWHWFLLWGSQGHLAGLVNVRNKNFVVWLTSGSMYRVCKDRVWTEGSTARGRACSVNQVGLQSFRCPWPCTWSIPSRGTWPEFPCSGSLSLFGMGVARWAGSAVCWWSSLNGALLCSSLSWPGSAVLLEDEIVTLDTHIWSCCYHVTWPQGPCKSFGQCGLNPQWRGHYYRC